MKKYFILLIIILISNSFAQTANSYFPENQGHVWHYKMIPLDTLNNPIDSLVTFRVDSFSTTAYLYNKDAKIVLTKTGTDPFLYSQPFLDTILYSFEQNIGYEYLGMNQLSNLIEFLSQFIQDSTGGVINFFKSFEGWQSNYRFANTVNAQYTILQRDTTFTIDTLVLPLRFQILGKRFNDQTIQTDIGQYTCKKFTLERRLSYLITFPPPIPPLAVKIVGIVDTLWIAPQNWIVKSFFPSSTVDLSLLGLGSFTIPGLRMDIHNPPVTVRNNDFSISEFQLYQNYPNPFNPVTVIQYSIKSRQYVTLKVFDILGNEISTLVDEIKEPGLHEVLFNSEKINNLSSGVYFYLIRAGNFVQTRKMILIR